jgi:hypothetical protein
MPELELPEAFGDLFTPARYKAYHGGRGSAKSWSFATALLIQGCEKPLRVLCAREVQLSIKDSVKQLLDDRAKALGLSDFYESTQHEIRGRNGTVFIFAGLGRLTTDQIKSMEGIDRAWVEEAQTISASSMEILSPTIRKDDSEIWFSWNPRHASDPVDQRFRGPVVPERSIIRRVNYDDNPFFKGVLEEEREFDERANPARYGHIWLGEYEPMAVGAIWDRLTIHQGRRAEAPPMQRILVGIDPAGSSESGANSTGIVAGGIGEDGRGYVLEDASLVGTPEQWAKQAIAVYDMLDADAIVVETNYGGEMVAGTIRSVRPTVKVIEVRATRGKHVRAEPIAALYSLGKISHVGAFPELENQMCLMTAAGYEGPKGTSPDRVDAMVWMFTELFPKLTPKTNVTATLPTMANNTYSPHRWR